MLRPIVRSLNRGAATKCRCHPLNRRIYTTPILSIDDHDKPNPSSSEKHDPPRPRPSPKDISIPRPEQSTETADEAPLTNSIQKADIADEDPPDRQREVDQV